MSVLEKKNQMQARERTAFDSVAKDYNGEILSGGIFLYGNNDEAGIDQLDVAGIFVGDGHWGRFVSFLKSMGCVWSEAFIVAHEER